MSALIYCPFPDRETARRISSTLVEERLVACANLIGPTESIFLWEGGLDTANEVAVLLKTDQDILQQAIERLGELHPYDIPAIIGWCCDVAHPATAAWLGSFNSGG